MKKPAIKFLFGSVDQEKSSKALQIGELVKAENVYQPTGGVFAKRNGFIQSEMNAVISTNPHSATAGDGNSVLGRTESTGEYFATDRRSEAQVDRGTLRPCIPRWEISIPALEDGDQTSPRPNSVLCGDNLWTFVKLDSIGEGDPGYKYQVRSAVDGVVLYDSPELAMDYESSCWSFAYDLTNSCVWMIYGSEADWRLRSIKLAIDHSTQTEAAYTSDTETFRTTSVKIKKLGTKFYVAATAKEIGSLALGQGRLHASILDTANGEQSSDADELYGAATSANFMSGVEILNESAPATAADPLWISCVGSTDASKLEVLLWKYVETGGALTTEAVSLIGTGDGTSQYLGSTTGYVSGTTGKIYSHYWVFTASPTIQDCNTYYTTVSTVAGLGTSETITYSATIRGAWLAGAMLKNNLRYFVTGFEDSDGIQKTLHMRNESGEIVAQIAYGEIACAGYGATATTRASTPHCDLSHIWETSAEEIMCFAPGFQSVNLTSSVDVGYVGVRLEEDGEVIGPVGSFYGGAIAPNAIPVFFSRVQDIHEAGPLMSPNVITIGASGYDIWSGGYAVVYRIVDSDARIWRSAPMSVLQTLANPAGTLDVSTLRHLLPGTTAQIEIYAGSTALYLQTVLDNNPQADTVTWTPSGGSSTYATDTEILYTTGGALPNSPPPPSKCGAIWRNRWFAGVRSDVYFSQEFSPGFGPQFNEILRATCPDGTGDITAIAPIDWNYLAVFKRDAVMVLSGPGPDGLGRGGYTAQTLSTRFGTINPKSVVSFQGGCLFQDTDSGKVCVITPSLQVAQTLEGANDSLSTVLGGRITATCHDPGKRHVYMFTDGDDIIVLDYEHPTQSQPLGSVYIWNSINLTRAYAATADREGPAFLDGTGIIWRQGTDYQDGGTGSFWNYFASLKTAHLQPDSIQGEFNASRVQFLGELYDDCTIGIKTYPNYSTTAASKTSNQILSGAAGQPLQIVTRPPNCTRCQALQVEIVETIGTGTGDKDNSRGFVFVALALELIPRGRITNLNSTQVI